MVANIKPDVVDQVLGKGTYERWCSIALDELIIQQTTAESHIKQYSKPWAQPMKSRLQADLKFATAVNDDYISFLERLSRNGGAVAAEGEKIMSVLVLAISILKEVNFTLSEMTNLGIKGAFSSLAGLGLAIEGGELEKRLKNLKSELERAKREIKEAWAQTAINASISGILLCSGPVGWLTLGAVGLGQLAADAYLGPSTSNATTLGSRANTTIGTAVSASEKYFAESTKVIRVTRTVGKVIPVVGFVFDANEISVGYRNANGLKKAMREAKLAQDKFSQKAKRHRGSFAKLKQKLNQLESGLVQRKGYTAETRKTLQIEIKQSGYSTR